MTNFSQILSFFMVSFIMIQSSVSESDSSKYLGLRSSRQLYNDEHEDAEARNLQYYVQPNLYQSNNNGQQGGNNAAQGQGANNNGQNHGGQQGGQQQGGQQGGQQQGGQNQNAANNNNKNGQQGGQQQGGQQQGGQNQNVANNNNNNNKNSGSSSSSSSSYNGGSSSSSYNGSSSSSSSYSGSSSTSSSTRSSSSSTTSPRAKIFGFTFAGLCIVAAVIAAVVIHNRRTIGGLNQSDESFFATITRKIKSFGGNKTEASQPLSGTGTGNYNAPAAPYNNFR